MPELKSENVTLIPFSEPWNMEYLWRLVNQYRMNTIHTKELFELAQKHGKYYWLGYTQAGLTGVLYLCFNPDLGWTLDAYRDDRLIRTVRDQKNWSFEAGELVCKYFFDLKICDSLYTMHDERNILATRLCNRLGFAKEKIISFMDKKYILLKRGR